MTRDPKTAAMPGHEPSGVLAPGSLVGSRYRIEALLGQGGMGHVYRAADLELDRVVALKTLGLVTTSDARRRFRREVRLAAKVTHPNVIRLFDLGSADHVTFLTMELVEGGSLRDRLVDGPLPVPLATAIARSVAHGLAAVHEVGVVHRDLKPANILLASGARVIIADFGVAGEVTENGVASAIVGTSSYMAPEQSEGRAATPATDLYALGLVVFEMLTGEIPLVGSGPVATAARRQTEVAPDLRAHRADAPPEIAALVGRLLAREPSDRPARATDVAVALAAW